MLLSLSSFLLKQAQVHHPGELLPTPSLLGLGALAVECQEDTEEF